VLTIERELDAAASLVAGTSNVQAEPHSTDLLPAQTSGGFKQPAVTVVSHVEVLSM
jgi:hypothetical protein